MPIPKNYNKDFFKTWSSDMAYILGFLYADGNIVKTKRGTHFVAIYTADKDLLTQMQTSLGSDHKIAARMSNTGAVYRLQIGSQKWFEDLHEIGLKPNKTNRMSLPDLPSQFIGDFIRGYFDGDGNVWTGLIHKDRPTKHTVLQVAFTSASLEFLKELQTSLKVLGVIGGSVRNSNKGNYARLSFSTEDALTIHKIMYNGAHKLYLPRKKQVFDKFVNCGGSSTG
ncbi:MAG: hypothetical protein RLZZ360_781 [Candidatus Parcubacteria bacterium]